MRVILNLQENSKKNHVYEIFEIYIPNSIPIVHRDPEEYPMCILFIDKFEYKAYGCKLPSTHEKLIEWNNKVIEQEPLKILPEGTTVIYGDRIGCLNRPLYIESKIDEDNTGYSCYPCISEGVILSCDIEKNNPILIPGSLSYHMIYHPKYKCTFIVMKDSGYKLIEDDYILCTIETFGIIPFDGEEQHGNPIDGLIYLMKMSRVYHKIRGFEDIRIEY